jgi:hypothetical protein
MGLPNYSLVTDESAHLEVLRARLEVGPDVLDVVSRPLINAAVAVLEAPH